FIKKDFYKERINSKYKFIAYSFFRERNRDRNGIRPSTERRLTSFKNYYNFGKTDNKYTFPKHEIKMFVTGRTTDYKIQIIVKYKDFVKPLFWSVYCIYSNAIK
ncbi:hypothetical protein PpBr36_02295, partial [Pyricularia pennisetigena]|uniref:hypothetical protein n=1 Tax=Pyricularia pennisetigena TaxID=1578925 RepID=UPI0011524BF4